MLEQQASVKKYANGDYVQRTVDTTEGIIHDQYTFGNCFLLRKHPALCGLIAQRHAMHFHEASIAAAGSQGMITSAAHLYNAAQQSGLLSHDIKWPDMDHVIRKQGSDWIFVGQRPKQGMEFSTQFHLAFGIGIHKFAKDYNSDRAKIDSKRSWQKRGTNRKLRNHARQVEVLFQRRAKDARQMAPTRATDETMAYVGEIVANFLHDTAGLERQAMTGMTSVEILHQYKLAIQADNVALKFNIMSLYLRCIELLRRIQRYCLEHAPYDYVKEEFDRDALDMNQILPHIFLDLVGYPRHHEPMFPKAVEFLRETIEKHGNRELELVKSRLLDVQSQDRSGREEAEPSFQNPQEDSISFETRAMFGDCLIGILDENMICQMPFRYRG
ncbi:hypothetical protein BDU57DRAFT_509462 [Ampelomyces quisqualis]|uniref:Uncharacterized protein n=1 Tax=Ampelomyces quisqualis TaxID=50730 RepID=A0A6A5R2D2_AMPQU|nr:hypothetical protein BDU57DRAFT_509462 [Ampelomyces quisqualis]